MLLVLQHQESIVINKTMSQIPSLPPKVHVSQHPCLLAKLSQLRSKSTSARDVKSLVHEISLIVGCEALASALSTGAGAGGGAGGPPRPAASARGAERAVW